MKKLDYITGLKGISSVKVVIFHFLICFYPALYFADVQTNTTLNEIAASPLFFLYNGSFSVYMFWTLSGFLLAYKSMNGLNRYDIVSKAFRRFPRLFFPVSIAILEGFLLVALGLTFNQQASLVCADSSKWMGDNVVWIGYIFVVI